MKITAPTTSSSIYDLLTTSQKDKVYNKLNRTTKEKIRIEAHGGTLWWTAVDDTAVVDECNSILDGDVEVFDLDVIDFKEIKVIASTTGVTFNIDII